MAYQYGYSAEIPHFEYAQAPAPSPPPAQYVAPPPPPSAFSPTRTFPASPGDYPYGASPLIFAASPAPSRAASQVRPADGEGEAYISAGRQQYLLPSGYGGLGRSNSERGRGTVVREHHRSGSHGGSRKKYYIDDDDRSDYTTSSYADSRRPSRAPSRARSSSHKRYHSRTPSGGSSEHGYEGARYAVALRGPSKQEQELNKKLEDVQKKLEAVQVNAERKRLEEEAKRLEKQRTAEIERLVTERIVLQRKEEEAKAKEHARKLAEEKKRIEEAATKLLDERAAAQKAAEKAAADAAAKQKADIAAVVAAERAKYDAAQHGKKTYTRFSKTHLCKEALDEQNVPYSEEADYFLVHRFVEKAEQQFLWNRTKEIRNYYNQIQEAADIAPTVQGPNGTWVKYVQIAGQPYPLALPVTITRTAGGGQTHHVEKVKWTDIFRR